MDIYNPNHYRLIDKLSAAASISGSVQEKVESVARWIVEPKMNNAQDKHASTTIQHMFRDIVYLVLNVPSSLKNPNDRIFTSIINQSNISSETQKMRINNSNKKNIPGTIFSINNKDSQKTLSIENRWKETWSKYYSLTKEKQPDGIFTWNQFLLHGCKNPGPIGISWEKVSDSKSFYINLMNSLHQECLAKTLSIPIMDDHDSSTPYKWIQKIISMPFNPPSLSRRIPKSVQQIWEEMQPTQGINLKETINFSIYCLIKSYSIWGGNSFISIPITVGVSPSLSPVTAVLSICSTSPLSIHKIFRWRHISEAIFPRPTLGGLVLEEEKSKAFTRGGWEHAQALAHESKNATIPIIHDLDYVLRENLPQHITKRISRASESLLLFNAETFAVQCSFSNQINHLEKKYTLQKITKENGKGIVFSVLQFILNNKNETQDLFRLHWEPRIDSSQAVNKLIELTGKSSIKEAITQNSVVWVVALIREVIGNIRICKPLRNKNEVKLEYNIIQNDKSIKLHIIQNQIEALPWAQTMSPNNPPAGIKKTNLLFGPNGANVGHVRIHSLNFEKQNEHYAVKLKTEIDFFIEGN